MRSKVPTPLTEVRSFAHHRPAVVREPMRPPTCAIRPAPRAPVPPPPPLPLFGVRHVLLLPAPARLVQQRGLSEPPVPRAPRPCEPPRHRPELWRAPHPVLRAATLRTCPVPLLLFSAPPF